MDWNFLTDNEPAVADVSDENTQLDLIKDNIGSYLWQYKPDFVNEYGVDDKEHLGIVAQELLKVPGLDSAVVQDENGVYKVKTDYVALATLGLVAALTRKVAQLEEIINNGTDKQEVPEDIPSGTESGTEEAGDEAGTAIPGEPVAATEQGLQPSLESTETEQSV